MRKTRAEYEPWLRDYLRKRKPGLEVPLLAAIDAYDTILEENRLDSELLAPIVETASSSLCALYYNATRLLGNLTAEYVLARQAVERMAADTRSQVRFNAIVCLNKTTPSDFTVHLLRKALRDKSAKVRWKAADQAGHLRLGELVPDLETALAVEKNLKAKQTIEFETRLLRDGYIMETVDDGQYCITTFTSNGVGSTWVSRAEIEQRGIEAIIAENAAR